MRQAPRPKDPIETFVRAAFQKGANRVMRRAGFKRPGGGWTWSRERPLNAHALRCDELSVTSTFPTRRSSFGWAHLRVSVSGRLVTGGGSETLQRHEHQLPLDIQGDAMDLAVSIEHWLRSEGLPWLDAPVDVTALAQRAAEDSPRLSWNPWEVPRLALLWRLAGQHEEAERLEATLAPRGDEDAPF